MWLDSRVMHSQILLKTTYYSYQTLFAVTTVFSPIIFLRLISKIVLGVLWHIVAGFVIKNHKYEELEFIVCLGITHLPISIQFSVF